MSITATTAATQTPAYSIGPLKAEILDYTIDSGTTSGTVQAPNLSRLYHVLLPSGVSHTAAPTYSGNIATLHVSVSATVQASFLWEDINYVAVPVGDAGNVVSIELVGGGPIGPPTVEVFGNLVRITGDDGNGIFASEIITALQASPEASLLINPVLVGGGDNAEDPFQETPLEGGITGGARGTAFCLGI